MKFQVWGKKSTFKILPLFMKNKSPCSIRTQYFRMVNQRNIHCAKDRRQNFGDIKCFTNALKSPCCEQRHKYHVINVSVVTYCHKKVEVTGCRGSLIRFLAMYIVPLKLLTFYAI